jgi:hypothetical protein
LVLFFAGIVVSNFGSRLRQTNKVDFYCFNVFLFFHLFGPTSQVSLSASSGDPARPSDYFYLWRSWDYMSDKSIGRKY